MGLAAPYITIQVELIGVHRCFKHHAVGTGHMGSQTLARHSLERFNQAADDPQLPCPESGVAVQVSMAVHFAR